MSKVSIFHRIQPKYDATTLLSVLSNTPHRAEVVRAAGVAVGAVLGELGRGLEDSRGLASTIVTTLGQGLKYNYNRAWQTVLSVLAITVEVDIHASPTTIDCNETLQIGGGVNIDKSKLS